MIKSVSSCIRALTKSRSKSTTGRSKVNARRRLGVEMPRGSVAKARRRQGKASPGEGVAKAKRRPDGGIASLGRRQTVFFAGIHRQPVGRCP